MNLRMTMTLAGALTLAVSGQDAAPPQTQKPAPLQNTVPSGKPAQQIEVAAPLSPRTNNLNTNALSNIQDPKNKRTLSGLGPELRKSTNRWKIFSLRRPANLKEDESNLTREALRTEASPAIKVISIDF